MLTGDLNIVNNKKLRKLISKGPNFREPRSINWHKSKDEIVKGIDVCMTKMVSPQKNITLEDLQLWKTKIIQKLDEKITSLRERIKLHKTNPVLRQEEVVEYLKTLHNKYVLVPIDKAANNVAIICKKYYTEVILKEIGILGECSNTYKKVNMDADEIIHDNIEYNKKMKLDVTDKDKKLPIMYSMPKLHKTPVGKRFIIASKNCSTKPLSKAVSNVFKLIYNQIENFHKKSKFLSNYNKFWVLQNINPIMDRISAINRKNRAKSIATYAFSTLYTTLPHDKLISRLFQIIDFVFEGGNNKFICISSYGKAYWRKKTNRSVAFSKSSLKIATKHLIQNCYFTVGNSILKQAIGIPMGIDTAPFWANLFLYTYEEEYISNLISTDRIKARHFHSTKRFIDDLCTMNDGGIFETIYREIYPPELDLKIEHSGTHATFLNLDITIHDGKFVYKLYDKRDAFPFYIVRMPHMQSNIPKSIFYSSLVGEFLRIARSTLIFDDFLPKAKQLINRMKLQGANHSRCKKSILKITNNHLETFSGYRLSADEIVRSLSL